MSMTAEERALKILGENWACYPGQDQIIENVKRLIRQAENDKLEAAAELVERVTQAQAQGWREHPKEDGCGGAIAVSNGGVFAAAVIRALKKD